MSDAIYSSVSKYHLDQKVCRKHDKTLPKEQALVVGIEFLIGGSIRYSLVWDNGAGGTAFEQELCLIDETEIVEAI